jgi:dUTP pyrophosphatase
LPPAETPPTLAPGARALIPTGVAIALPRHGSTGAAALGLLARHGVAVLNSPARSTPTRRIADHPG